LTPVSKERRQVGPRQAGRQDSAGSSRRAATRHPVNTVKRTVFVLAFLPAAFLVYGFFTDDLTADPIAYITDITGVTALSFLVASLTVTPLRRLTRWNEIIKLRRMLGLFAFFYACLHVLTWSVLDWFFDYRQMAEDIVERPFITIGMLTFLLLLPLAVTSTNGMIRRLGRRWQLLHRLAYVAAITAVIHFWWLVKADLFEPRLWAFALCLLFGFRAWWIYKGRVPSSS
jgi:sulfoxide reductase heme-binding subunit YedZ